MEKPTNRRYQDPLFDRNAKFERIYKRLPTRTEARRFQRGTFMKYRSETGRIQWNTMNKYTTNDVVLYKGLLKKEYYTVLLLWSAGKSQEQIATELQIPVGTVKSRTHRASKIIDKIREQNKPVIPLVAQKLF